MRGLILVLLLCSQADASNLFERYRYQKNGCWYYGYRPYYSPLKSAYNSQSVQYNYTINYAQPAAHQGATQYGLSDISDFYGAVDFGAAFHQAGRLAEGSQRLTEKATSGYLSILQATSADRTQVAAILAQGQAASQALSAAKPQASTVVREHTESKAEMPAEVRGGNLEATSQACANCHGAGAEAKGGGVHLPKLADLSIEQAKIAKEYITRLDSNNCARKANLSHDAQQELLDYLCKKINQ